MFWLFIFCFLRIESKRYYELKVILFLEIMDLFVDLTLTTAGIWRVEIWIQHQGVCAASWKQRRVKTLHLTIVPVQMTINDCNRKCAFYIGTKVFLQKQTTVNFVRPATAPALWESPVCKAKALLDESFIKCNPKQIMALVVIKTRTFRDVGTLHHMWRKQKLEKYGLLPSQGRQKR